MIPAVAISAVALQMSCVAGLLGTRHCRDRSKSLQIVRRRSSTARRWRFARSPCSASIRWLLGDTANATDLTLPIGLPWLGAHFRLDALAAFFLVVVNLGGAVGKPLWPRLRPPRPGAAPRAAVLSRLSGRHESGGAGGRRLFLSAVLGIHVARLLGAGHGASPRTRQREGGLRLSGDGKLRHAGAAARLRPAGGTGGRLRICGDSRGPAYTLRGDAGPDPDAARRRFKGRPGAVARLAAARPSRGAQPRLGADERRHDQGRDLRFHSRRVRSAGTADLVGERGRAVPRRHHRRHGNPLRHDGKGSKAPAGLQHDRKRRHHLRRASALHWPSRPTA